LAATERSARGVAGSGFPAVAGRGALASLAGRDLRRDHGVAGLPPHIDVGRLAAVGALAPVAAEATLAALALRARWAMRRPTATRPPCLAGATLASLAPAAGLASRVLEHVLALH